MFNVPLEHSFEYNHGKKNVSTIGIFYLIRKILYQENNWKAVYIDRYLSS